MYRTLFAWGGMLGLVAVTAGCAMCDAPYDYCYPLFTGGCDGQPCVGPRAGSIRAMDGPVVPYYEETSPGQAEPYYDQSGPAPIAPQPQVQPQMQMQMQQSRQAVPRSQMPWHRNAPTSRQSTADARQLIPAADRQTAKILSVTDETLGEVQARKAESPLAGEQPAPASGTTLR